MPSTGHPPQSAGHSPSNRTPSHQTDSFSSSSLSTSRASLLDATKKKKQIIAPDKTIKKSTDQQDDRPSPSEKPPENPHLQDRNAASRCPPGLRKDQFEVRNQDISDDQLQAAIHAAFEAVSKHDKEVQVAQYIKNEFDEKFGPKWHCVVGRHFASHVSYEPNHYVYLKIGREVILLFKSGGPLHFSHQLAPHSPSTPETTTILEHENGVSKLGPAGETQTN